MDVADPEASPRSAVRGARVGSAVAVVLLAAAFTVPPLTGWDVGARSDRFGLAPLHGYWEPGVGWGTVPALLLAVWGVVRVRVWSVLPWSRLLLASFGVGLLWLLALALVDGVAGLTRALGNPYEYLPTAREIDDVGAMLREYVDRIPYSHADNWVVHVAGHPPAALLFFVALDRIGLGGDLAAALVVVLLAASIPLAVLQTLRTLGAETAARRVAPFLVLAPTAVFLAVSADAVFTAVGAWGLAALAAAAVTSRAGSTPGLLGWGAVAGLLLGTAVMLSYGLPLLGTIALGVLAAARSWRPLPVAAVVALAVVLAFAAGGFAWWEAYPVLVDRYWDGIASDRPFAYWAWGNLAALLVASGPVLATALGHLAEHRRRVDRVVLLLVAGAATAVLLADLSRMSKAEVERIWLPFLPWLMLATTALPDRWVRPALAIQLASALVVQHLLYTSW
jgi:methylthioxylose transferase